MADTPPPPYSETASPPSNAADQARIRKERREAKIKAGGSARLNKITGLGGGVQRDSPTQQTPTPITVRTSTADPDEVDISQNPSEHYYQPQSNRAPAAAQNAFSSPVGPQLTEDQFRAMMFGLATDRQPAITSSSDGTTAAPDSLASLTSLFGAAPGAGFGPGPGPGSGADDPMIAMLQQMMGNIPGKGAGGGGPFGDAMPGMGGPGSQAEAAAAVTSPYAYVWRIVHAVFALTLGLYMALTTSFTGTEAQRKMSGLVNAGELGLGLDAGVVKFFYIFATCEVLLQTARFWLEGPPNVTGVLRMVIGFLPQQWRSYIEIFLSYSRVWTTISGDAMVCVFVLGVCSWLRST